ncbi:uncharacterized protein LOC128240816 [Mya arenaria]|nr:uncharacterized protein LOC128240816 [Mya arenaria]
MKDRQVKLCQAILDDLFKEYDGDDDDTPTVCFNVGGSLTVASLTGDSFTIPFDPNMEILQLKSKVRENMQHDVRKQRLIYKEKELEDMVNGRKAKLADFKVAPNCTINLLVLLYAVPDNLNDVVFDLGWDFPSHGNVWLDAIIFFYANKTFINYADYRESKQTPLPGIRHTGDVWDRINRKGHQVIYLTLKSIPSNITHMFLLLSAYEGTLQRFPKPYISFYETSNRSKDLCRTTIQHALSAKTVIMCYMTKRSGRWELFESGKLCGGHIWDHAPMKTVVEDLIAQGC